MAKGIEFAMILLLGYLLCQSLAMTTSDEERFLDKEYNAALLNWLITYQFPQRVNNLCKYYSAGNQNTPPMPKRNSELINSLLSLPKNMNDAVDLEIIGPVEVIDEICLLLGASPYIPKNSANFNTSPIVSSEKLLDIYRKIIAQCFHSLPEVCSAVLFSIYYTQPNLLRLDSKTHSHKRKKYKRTRGMDDQQGDICRVCRCEAQSDRPLFYPCICTGSIKYIHQDCLTQWMRYSHKEYCELCGHRFSFQPIYSPDMPRVLPLRDVAGGLLSAVVKATKSWFHYSLVGLAWFGVVPLSAYRTYRYLFRASTFDMILSLPFDVFSTENLASDAFRGCFVVTCTLLSFVGLVWLREQILHGGGPDWLERDDVPAQINDEEQIGEAAGAGIGGEDVEGRDIDRADGVAIEGINDDNNNGNVGEPFMAPMDNEAQVVADPEQEAEEAMIRNLYLGNGGIVYGVDANINNDQQPIDAERDANPIVNEQIPAGDRVDVGVGANLEGDNENDNDEPNWNPMEWDRAAEELTWERLLGLDGSLVFLEHVFWIISLNTMFIFTFAFCPYCIGNFTLRTLDLLEPEKPLMHFHGLITTLFGYCCVGLTLVILHFFARIFRLRRVRWFLGLCYIVVKVSLLSVVEIGVLPLVCGWWLDICSLPLFDASIKDRKVSFKAAPGTSLFVHWMFGMVYVYYFAAFISLLREVLRPGVLWFLRNLNDPDFSPIQEMIHLPILRHVRRLVASAMIFGSAVLLILWLPIRILQLVWPNFLPYTLSGDSEVNELSLQLLLLQIILPGFFEQPHTRVWLKGLLRIWCICVSWVLGIRSYLLGNMEQQVGGIGGGGGGGGGGVGGGVGVGNGADQQAENVAMAANGAPPPAAAAAAAGAGAGAAAADVQPAPPQQHAAEVQAAAPRPLPLQAERNLAAAHQAMMQRDVPVGFQPYDRPTFFALRLCGLLCFICVSLVIASLITITVPVTIGRQVMALWSLGGHITNVHATVPTQTQAAATTVAAAASPTEVVAPRSHELYTAAVGTYLCWIVSRGIAIAVNLLPQGRTAVINKLKQWLRAGASYTVPALIFVLMLGVIPLLFGLLLELVVVIPLRVPLYQTPVHFFGQDWALGVLYTKIAIALTLMGPDWHLKRAIERAYRDGLRDIDLKFLIRDLATPVITFFGLALAIPYVIGHSILPIFFERPVRRLEIARTSYPAFFIIVGIIAYIYFEINQFKKLYVAIKIDKYLVGQRLVNYEHRKRKLEAEAEAENEAEAEAEAESESAADAENDQNEGKMNDDEYQQEVHDEGDQQRRQAAAAFAERVALVNQLLRDELL